MGGVQASRIVKATECVEESDKILDNTRKFYSTKASRTVKATECVEESDKILDNTRNFMVSKNKDHEFHVMCLYSHLASEILTSCAHPFSKFYPL